MSTVPLESQRADRAHLGAADSHQGHERHEPYRDAAGAGPSRVTTGELNPFVHSTGVVVGMRNRGAH